MNGERLQFRASGLYNGVFVMVDNGTGSTWSDLDGSALSGLLAGEQLDIQPLQTTTWGSWLEEHPETTTVGIETGYSYRNVVRLGREGLRGGFIATLEQIDPRLPEGELVIGVLAANAAAAFPIGRVPADAPMQDGVGGVPVVVLEDAEGSPSLAYHRVLSDGRVLAFVTSFFTEWYGWAAFHPDTTIYGDDT